MIVKHLYIAPKGLTNKRHHKIYDNGVFEDRRDITIIKFVFSSWRKVNNVGRILLDTLFDTYKKKKLTEKKHNNKYNHLF